MKRSEINLHLAYAKRALEKNGIALPGFAHFSPDDWKNREYDFSVIRKTMLGWDITDFGSNDFKRMGTVLFTIRNGSQQDASIGTPYAEKLLFVLDGQRLPLHCHLVKTEDIINRGGGSMFMRLYRSAPDGSVDCENDVEYYSDGVKRKAKAGQEIIVTRGNSVTLAPGVYHSFGAVAGAGDLIGWEVSSVNDDHTDNVFAEKVSRFAEIEEDEQPVHLLCNEYGKYF